MTSKRKRKKPWGALNLMVNVIRLSVDLIRWFWQSIP